MYPNISQSRVTFGGDRTSNPGLYTPVSLRDSYSDLQYQTPPPSPSVGNGRPGFLPSHLFPSLQSSVPDQQEDFSRNWSGPQTTAASSARKTKLFDDYNSTPRYTPERTSSRDESGRTPPIDKRQREELQAPPIQSLYDTDLPPAVDANEMQGSPMNIYSPPSTPFTSTSSHPPMTPSGSFGTPISSTLPSTVAVTPIQTPFKESTIVPATPSTPGLLAHDDRWVTVFGFPPSSNALTSILRYFQNFGEITSYQSGEGNWVHIQYQTKLQAQKALTKNARVIEEGLMIGVCPCTDSKLVGSSAQGPVTPATLVPRSLKDAQPVLHSRPAPASPYAVENPPQTGSGGIWSKFSEYVFSL